jgi:pimeloyl-ACP methyl ester carboxylesterase
VSAVVETRVVQARDGRELCVEVAGEPAQRTVLLHNGTPNSRHLYRPWIDDAAGRGAQLISYDRPGYGGSTPQPDHTVADAAADVRALADALGIDRLAVWGLSGGGPYTLACAALLPDLVVAAAVVGSVAPWDAPGLDYMAGMGESNVDGIEKYLSDPEAARAEGHERREELLNVTPEQLLGAWKTLLSDVDAAVATGEFAAYIVHSMHDGLGPGDQGWWDDGVAHMTPWGFDLASIRVPVKVWHGRHDRFVPFQHGQWLAQHIPGAEAELSETDGHLTLLVDRIPAVHEWLLSRY